jgi:hypothetical protein
MIIKSGANLIKLFDYASFNEKCKKKAPPAAGLQKPKNSIKQTQNH